MQQKVEAVRQKGNTPASWDVKDLGIMVSWFKCIGDSKMPTTKDKLITRYEQTMAGLTLSLEKKLWLMLSMAR